jgi:hypothetical protein
VTEVGSRYVRIVEITGREMTDRFDPMLSGWLISAKGHRRW